MATTIGPFYQWVTENDVEKVPSHHTVRQCVIALGGRMHTAAAVVWIAHAHDNVVEYNDIYDLYRIGICVGGTWGYGPSRTHHNDMGFNRIHTIGQGVLSDMSAVYTLGVSPGTRVHDNRCHDIRADPLFVAPEKDDFRLKEESPAMRLGFKPFDFSRAERTSPPVLTAQLPEVPKAFE